MSARFVLRPLIWTGPVTEQRTSSSQFRASWDDTVSLLLREVDLLDGGVVAVQVDASESDIRRDGMLRARARVGFPGVRVSFDSRHGPLTYATDQYEQTWSGSMPGWQANVRAIALGLQALRAVDRYGITRTGEQYRGWQQISAHGAEDDMTVAEAARVMGDAAGISPYVMGDRNEVVKAYRKVVQTAHPDRGGNADVFRLVTKARDVLLGGTQ